MEPPGQREAMALIVWRRPELATEVVGIDWSVGKRNLVVVGVILGHRTSAMVLSSRLFRTMTRCCLVVLLVGVALVPAAPVTIVVDPPMPAPWALLERQLLADNLPACREFFEKYYDPRGYLQVFLRWGANDGPDDAFENFNRWPELHALGGDEEIVRLYLRGWEGMIRRFLRGEDDRRAGRARRHVCEGLLRAVGLDAPRRGPAALQPYGSLGARSARVPRSLATLCGALHGRGCGRTELRSGPETDSLDDQWQPRPDAAAGDGARLGRRHPFDTTGFVALHGESTYAQFLEHYREYTDVVGDHFLNLVATTLPTNAFMLTGEAKYRRWIVGPWTRGSRG